MIVNRRTFTSSLAAAAVAPLVRPVRVRVQSGSLPITRPSEAALAQLSLLMEVTGVPGVSMGVVRDGKLVWQYQAGVVDAETKKPVDRSTLFPAASLGKPVFAHAALRLVDEGKLDLDAPLKSYVPDHAPADPHGDRISARHVLSHSTGLRNWRNSADQPLVPAFEPGSRFQYSGEGFYYLQRAVEKIAGTSFERFMEERLFEPIDMRSSTYGWREDTAARLWVGHRRGEPIRRPSRDFAERLFAFAEKSARPLAERTHEEIVAAMAQMRPAPAPLPNFIIPNAAASLLTTLGDYAAFLNRVLDPADDRVDLRSATRQQMFKPQTRINSVLAWGLGWGLESVGGRDYIWHWGDNGTFKNFVLAHLPSRTGIVVFTNGAHGMRIAEHIVASASVGEHLAFDWL